MTRRTAPLATELAAQLAACIGDEGSRLALADAMGLPYSTLRRLLSGRGSPTVRTLRAVAAYFEGVFTVDDLERMHHTPAAGVAVPPESGRAGGETRMQSLSPAERRSLAQRARAARACQDASDSQGTLWRTG